MGGHRLRSPEKLFEEDVPPPEPPPRLLACVMKNPADCYAVADSGANIAVCPTQYAAKLGIQLKKWESPIRIAFGKVGSMSVSEYYGYFGPLLGKVAFLDDAAEALFPIWQMTRNGFEVIFGEQTVDVVEKDTRHLAVRGFADQVQCLCIFV